ncbi:uncharacterized protein [Clytia hemisphaerica]
MTETLIYPYFTNSTMDQPPNKALPLVPDEAPKKQLPLAPDDYSYASIEFRSMALQGNVLVTTAIDDKTKPPSSEIVESEYSYAPFEPSRPLVVGVGNAVTTPISDEKPLIDIGDSEQEDFLHQSINGDIYALVDKPPKYKAPTKQTPTTDSRRPSAYDVVADPLPQDPILEELYASVQKPKPTNSMTLSNRPAPFNNNMMTMNNNNMIYPAGFKPGKKRVSDGMLNTKYFANNGTSRKPPPMPRPYGLDRKPLSPHIEERLDFNNRATRSTGNVANTSSDSYSEVTIDQTKQPSRFVNLESSDRLTKSYNSDQLGPSIKQMRTHRRNLSHEDVSIFHRSSIDNSRETLNGHSSAMSDKSSRLSNSSSSISNRSEDESFPPRINLATTDYYSRVSTTTDPNNDELPEGWQEVKDDSETYYWHIWTGTIQYERPTALMTPTSSSRSVSPFNSEPNSRATSITDQTENLKISTPSPRPETPDTMKAKQIISFPVHSMGWMDVEEDLMGAQIIGETVNNCITTLANLRHDLHKTEETWANGEDLKLILEGETLKLVHPETKHVYHKQPIAKMRVWGVGREGEEKRDFAYIARDQTTQKHKCHMFRCHGHVSGRSVTNALQAICTRVLEEKKRAKERENSTVKPPSDLMRPPSKLSGSNFNEKVYPDQKKCFTAKYVGSAEVAKPSGMEGLNKVVKMLTEGESTSSWPSVLLEVTTSEIKTIDCLKQETTMEHRVRFVTFLGVATDERFGAYIVAVAKDMFVCHVYFCAPNAGTLTKAIEEAMKLRFEKMLDSQQIRRPSSDQPAEAPLKLQPVPQPHNQQHQNQGGISPQRGSVKEKTTKMFTGMFSKFNKGSGRRKEEETPPNSRPSSIAPSANEHVIRYFGAIPVTIGTGKEPIEASAKQLGQGEAMLGYLEVDQDCLTLSDAQRSAISQRIFDVANISYCGTTGDRKFFGVIVSRGKGKFICHVFQEYQPNTGLEIVDAIHNVL